MEKVVKTENVHKAFGLINAARLTKMADDDKIAAIRLIRVLKPVSHGYEEATRDATDKLRPDNFDERLQKGQEYERLRREGKTEGLPLTDEEYAELVKEVAEFNRLAAEAVRDIAEKEVTLTYDTLSDDAFGKLIASNDWTVEQILLVESIMLG